ncbi:MAG: hypothetical protein AOA66_0168 [Candidatus Bathyarchaeota archaeon BA2]|nr:MAG: hypothetical protein AOA66_0168 [Candidatus Bathyarchaeota archaeon BA2]
MKTKCVNCGEPMLKLISKEGLVIWICGKVKIHRFGEIWQGGAMFCEKPQQKEAITVANK